MIRKNRLVCRAPLRRPGRCAVKAKPVGTQDNINILFFCMDQKGTGKSRASHTSRNGDGITLSNTLGKKKRLVKGSNRLGKIEMSSGSLIIDIKDGRE